MADEAARVAVEIGSGPRDGEVTLVEDGEFTIGSAAECEVVLAGDGAAPASAHVEFRVERGRVSVESSEAFMRDGALVTDLREEAMPLLVRVGTTDVFLLAPCEGNGGGGEGGGGPGGTPGPDPGLSGSSDDSAERRWMCSSCSLLNPPEAGWCERCGFDKPK